MLVVIISCDNRNSTLVHNFLYKSNVVNVDKRMRFNMAAEYTEQTNYLSF